MKISELKNAPQWLIDAETSVDADVDIINGIVYWNSGEFRGGAFRGGAFWGGAFWGGEFCGGEFRGGAFRGGAFCGGAFRGGEFCGGAFRGGEFLGGEFRGGEFCGGAFRGGAFRGGAFWGGEFLGGEFRGGEFWGEHITICPLSVYGLRWPVVIAGTQMHIGCERRKIDEWRTFDDATINKMDRGALKFWRANKATLLTICDSRESA